MNNQVKMKKLYLLLAFSSIFLNIHSQPVEFNYISPVPGSQYINPEQVIILKTGYGYDPLSLQHAFALVKGDVSGEIMSSMSLSPDHKTLFVHPLSRFSPGEKIHLFISPGLKTEEGKNIGSTWFDFYIRQDQAVRHQEFISPENPPYPETSSYKNILPENRQRENNLPPDYPAPVNVYTTPDAEDGYIFYTPTVRLTPQFEKYLTIWDNYGTPVYYQKVSKTVTDFKVLDDELLAYAVNAFAYPENNCYYLMDGNYTLIDSVKAGNGYNIDNHDLLLLDNGHYLIMIYDVQTVNMSLIVPGGMQNAQVTGLVIQEVDNNKNVYFQWRSWDHFEITDATWDIDLTSYYIDYVHANALDLDSDGNILVSCRHLDEVTKIDFTTGNVIWRWGNNAVNNDFTFTNDPIGFSHQHDIRKLDNGNYTVFDNGNLHVPPLTQALEYHLDETGMQCSRVWSYQHNPPVYSPLTGGNQRLANNNRLICWGGTASPTAITEVNPNNEVVMEFTIPDSVTGYRARKYTWQTTMFSAQDQVSFGNYGGQDAKEYQLQVTNHFTQSIQITSAYNQNPENFYAEGLPLVLAPGASKSIRLYFQPGEEGTYEDILTLNYDNAGNTRRVARQVKLSAVWDPELPVVTFDPANGSLGFDPAGAIEVSFSEPVSKIFGIPLTDQDVPNLFYLRQNNLFGTDVGFHGTVSADKTRITVIPNDTLDPGQQYYIQLIPNKIQDSDGNVVTYSDFSFFITGTGVGIAENRGTDDVRVYPNPSKDFFTIASGQKITKVEIFSAEMCLLTSMGTSDRIVVVDASAFPNGMYQLMVRLENGMLVSRSIIVLK